jgi:hypothetical protein
MQHLKVMVVDDTSVSRMLLVDGLNGIGIKNIVLAGAFRHTYMPEPHA